MLLLFVDFGFGRFPASYGNHEIEQVSFIKGFLITGTYSYTCLLCV